MESPIQRAQARLLYVQELSAFYGTSFEQEFKTELAREVLGAELDRWAEQGFISLIELGNLETSLALASF